MDNPDIEPVIKIGGSAFCDNSLNATRPIGRIKNSNKVVVVSLTQWCSKNFITKRVGRTLIKKKYLVAFRFKGQWWVTANPDCLNELLEYLGIEELAFNVEQN